MIIASNKELFEALEYLYYWSAFPDKNLTKKQSEKITSINEQLEDLGVTDDEGCFKNTVLGLRAQTFEQKHYS